MIDPMFFEQLKNFNFIVRTRVSNIYAGRRKSELHGRGIETTDYNEYHYGDDIKAIDWNIYARTDKLYVRRYEEEKSLVVHVLIDGSKSMDFSTTGTTKFDYGAMLGLGFAYLAVNENERFGIATYNTALKSVIPPKKGRSHFLKAIDILNGEEKTGKTDLGVSALQYAHMLKYRSLMIIISDFLEPIEGIKEGLFRFKRGLNDIVVLQVLDPAEINLNVLGDTKIHDMETADIERLYISSEFKERYRENLISHSDSIRKTCNDLGADFFSVRCDTPVFETFSKLLKKPVVKREYKKRAG